MHTILKKGFPMKEKPECKNGCVYYNATKKKCDYSEDYTKNVCAIDDLPFYDTPKNAPNNKLIVSHKLNR
jgi:hypothetical protein